MIRGCFGFETGIVQWQNDRFRQRCRVSTSHDFPNACPKIETACAGTCINSGFGERGRNRTYNLLIKSSTISRAFPYAFTM